MAEKRILIITGEPSGDQNAANLILALKSLNPQIKVIAVGGQHLREAGAEIICDINDLAVLGFFDVLKKLPKFFALKKLVLEKIEAEKPDALILVDFSGFNLRLAKEIKKKILTIYYTSPQVWASRAGRIKTIKENIHKMVVFFKFEEELYKKYGISADFVGHPLLDIVKMTKTKNELLNQYKLYENKATITLLPGSRKQEIKKILPVMLDACVLIHRNLQNTQFLVAKPVQADWGIYHPITHRYKIDLKVVEGKTYDCLNAADFCMVASGTATLETAIMQKPFVVIYKMGLLNYLLYRPQVKVPYIGMVNIVAGKKIIPEFIQFNATAKKISEKVLETLNQPACLQEMKENLAGVKQALGENGASLRAARLILEFLK